MPDGLGLIIFNIETEGKSQSVVAQNVMKIIQKQFLYKQGGWLLRVLSIGQIGWDVTTINETVNKNYGGFLCVLCHNNLRS